VVESVRVSHSIPDATNLIIKTPVGTILHASDFKFDFTPIDGRLPDVGRLAQAGNEGILLMLSDSLGSERKGYTPSEKTLSETLDREMTDCPGRIIVTTMSSNISRWQQAIDSAVRHGRRIAISGRSIERNIEVASKLGYIKIPKNAIMHLKDVKRQPPKTVCILMAGSQAQEGSALERVADQEHHDVSIQPGDKVIFSSDYIPGNESAVQSLIDSLSKLGASVVYSGLYDNLHVSGHGSQQDLLLMMNLARAKYIIPIGGSYRHMVQYSRLAQDMGYAPDKILIPSFNQTIEVTQQKAQLSKIVEVNSVMVDGLGIGDVGNVILRDRQHLAEEGVVVVVAEMDQNDLSKIINLEIISRGFVFGKENTFLFDEGAKKIRQVIDSKKGKIESDRYLRQIIVDNLERHLFDQTHRRPMILPVIVQV
jgi:ribonuclease J